MFAGEEGRKRENVKKAEVSCNHCNWSNYQKMRLSSLIVWKRPLIAHTDSLQKERLLRGNHQLSVHNDENRCHHRSPRSLCLRLLVQAQRRRMRWMQGQSFALSNAPCDHRTHRLVVLSVSRVTTPSSKTLESSRDSASGDPPSSRTTFPSSRLRTPTSTSRSVWRSG